MTDEPVYLLILGGGPLTIDDGHPPVALRGDDSIGEFRVLRDDGEWEPVRPEPGDNDVHDWTDLPGTGLQVRHQSGVTWRPRVEVRVWPPAAPPLHFGDVEHDHVVGDTHCEGCWREPIESHGCDTAGCLEHNQFGDENRDGDYWLYTMGDLCRER